MLEAHEPDVSISTATVRSPWSPSTGPRRNAVDPTTATSLYEVFSAFDDDRLPGRRADRAGGTFCAGADLQSGPGERYRVAEDGPGPMGPTRLELTSRSSPPSGAAVAGAWSWPSGATSGWRPRTPLRCVCRRFGVPRSTAARAASPAGGQGRALDLILTGRRGGRRGPGIGLVNRVVPHGHRPRRRRRLGHELAALPQACLRNDRRSASTSGVCRADDAIVNELRLGLDSLSSPERHAGPARFAAGAGRRRRRPSTRRTTSGGANMPDAGRLRLRRHPDRRGERLRLPAAVAGRPRRAAAAAGLAPAGPRRPGRRTGRPTGPRRSCSSGSFPASPSAVRRVSESSPVTRRVVSGPGQGALRPAPRPG